MKKKEILFILIILILAAAMWAGMKFMGKNESGDIRITVDGEEYGIYSLSQNQVISIGETNVCEIKDGQVTMIQADCPDHLCMHQKPVGTNGGTIVCLPNKVVIEGSRRSGSDASAVDSVA